MRTITDTADRIRTCDQLAINGKPVQVANVKFAPTAARPARLAVTVFDPNGALTELMDTRTVYLDAGETVTFKPGTMHLADAAGRRPGFDVAPALHLRQEATT